ncbi:hypothetical protein IB655_04325 [Francisella noatunensis]|uniref:Uncharacterized protein n=1 Tax=Francisella noatunensis TaxID=657445 RepID=A0A9Q2KXD8_9GAMM|nr:transposase family protein [Francisella noatunensis]MBK2028110.1 hypothetical protein [Francisella noatunensis]MBK2048914.1 hypothetical protein [Francisella noatunensis]MBK2049724.1 hypothetical protein [Francisella noatunensis]MBK2051571.1 hypothetical protein [Francisella noatunensis]MBK2053509.1 hypothetical protein [Francisella noatunensis]
MNIYFCAQNLDKADFLRHISSNTCIWADTGFQGIQDNHMNVEIPIKRTKIKPLTTEQKEENKIITCYWTL